MNDNEKYIRLITSEHATKPLYVEYVEAFLSFISPAVDILNDFQTLFNLQNAEGDQLDILGGLVGVSRVLPVDNPEVNSVLEDDMYRKVILARILSNRWDGTRKGLENIMAMIFPGLPSNIIDNQDMSVIINVIDPQATEEFKTLLELGYILPKPAGVQYEYTISDSPLFGWDSDTAFIKGWDSGVWQ